MKRLNIISALLAAAASVAGIFLPLYRDEAWAVAQMKGQDAVTIIAAAVLITVSLRNGIKDRIAAAGLNAYMIYTYFFYALELELNPLFHIYLAIVLISIITLIRTVSDLQKISSAGTGKASENISVVYLCAVGSMLAFLWNADIISSIAGSPLLETADGKPLTIVYVFDLTFVLPVIVYSIYLLKKNRPFGVPLCGIVLVKAVTMGAALVGMTLGSLAGGFEFEGFLAAFWTFLAVGGLITLFAFLKSARIHE